MTRSRGVAVASGETVEVITARTEGAAVFEAMLPGRLTSANNRLVLHDYLGGEPVLPAASTAATLVDADRRADLRAGDFLLLEEVLDPVTGDAAPDITARHVVRLTEVLADTDPVGVHDATGVPGLLPVLRVRWGAEDALPFDLKLARVTSGDALDGIAANTPDQPSAVARGNVVLIDHGETQAVPHCCRGGRRAATICR